MRERINNDVKSAMKAGEKAKLATLRLVTAAIKSADIEAEMAGKKVLDDAGIVQVLTKMIKQRRDSIAQYEAAQRQDLADAEKFEVQVLSAYMPQGLTAAEVEAAVAAALAESGAKGPADMGKVMAIVKPRVAGRADMAEVSRLIRARLAAP